MNGLAAAAFLLQHAGGKVIHHGGTMRARTWILMAAVAASIVEAQPQKLEPAVATIICYHVVESPFDTEFSITRQTFLQQMQYLAATGYRVVSLADVYDYVAGRRESLPKNAVVITVDDGYRCVHSEIYPILKKYRFPFTVFIYPKWIGQSSYALSWSQIEEMAASGVDIQSHSLSHSSLTLRSNGTANRTYLSWLRAELEGSKEEIEKRTGQPVRFLAYPYGDYDPLVASHASAAGYAAGLTCDFGPVREGSDPFRLRRIVIRKDTTLASFRRRLGAEALELEATEPLSGSRFEAGAPVVSATIRDFRTLDPASVQMAVLSLGRTPFSYDPRNGTISLVVREELKGNLQRAFVWGNDRKTGKRMEASWTFYLNPPSADATVGHPPERRAIAPAGDPSRMRLDLKKRRR